MSVLTINTSARLEGANSRAITDYLVQQLGRPVIERDLVKTPLPAISAEDLIAVHGSHQHSRSSLQQHLALSDTLITELQQAETLVLGVAMYNFSVPTYLKQWVDYVCRAGVTFRYTDHGPEGLLNIQRAFIVTASGGTPIGGEWDFASPYLAHICRFLGIAEVVHIDVSGSKGEPEQVLAAARKQVDAVLQPALEEA